MEHPEDVAGSAVEENEKVQDQGEEKEDLKEDEFEFGSNSVPNRVFAPSELDISKVHKFWDTQPVPKMNTMVPMQQVLEQGPIDPIKTVEEVRQAPYNIGSAYEWVSIDVWDDEWMNEIYTLLTENYVEDDDSMFRFDYSVPFLRWAICPPGYLQDWHLGVAVKGKKKLVGFITAIPANVNVHGQVVQMVEINFLCVMKKLRDKRLAPILIKEITRRVNLSNIWQAVYTAGVVIPTPVSQARYYHRSLNPIKLVEIGFSRLGPRLNKARAIRLFKVPDKAQLPGIRPMQERDVRAVQRLLMEYLRRFSIYVDFTQEEVAHFFLPREDVVYSYVVQDPETREITDFCSFYSLPSSILHNPKHNKLRVTSI